MRNVITRKEFKELRKQTLEHRIHFMPARNTIRHWANQVEDLGGAAASYQQNDDIELTPREVAIYARMARILTDELLESQHSIKVISDTEQTTIKFHSGKAYTTQAAANMLQVTRQYVAYLVKNERLTAVNVDGRFLLDYDSVRELAKERGTFGKATQETKLKKDERYIEHMATNVAKLARADYSEEEIELIAQKLPELREELRRDLSETTFENAQKLLERFEELGTLEPFEMRDGQFDDVAELIAMDIDDYLEVFNERLGTTF